MANLKMETLEGLRAACQRADRRLGQHQESIQTNARFLREVAELSEKERESEIFLRRIWDENPLGDLGHGDYDLSKALSDDGFRHRFHGLINNPLPDTPSERAIRLDAMFAETLTLVQPFVPPNRSGHHHKPLAKTARVFAALFPHDFTALIREPMRLRLLRKALGGSVAQRFRAMAERRILDRLEDAIGPVDRSDWNGVARRMMLPAILLELYDTDSPDPARPVDRPELSRITKHFESIEEDGTLIFERDMVESLHLGLWARERRHFAVLTGLSGTGKTQLALEYAKAVTGEDEESNGRVRTIAVQPGWYDPTPLLGYVNPLGENRYTATEFLRFLIRATENPSQPHVCVLDEMNLSHPEQYLAPILSAMELEHGEIELHSGDADEYGIASSIHYPDNLVLIGTVNMDETTMGISDKVLDRAFTLEFWDVDVDRWPGWERTSLVDQDREATMAVLTRVMEALSPARLHFGWRVIEEVVRFMEQRRAQTAALSVKDALDRVIYAKILPKLRGDDSPRFRKALAECQTALNERILTRSARKVEELIEDVDQTGSFRFWR